MTERKCINCGKMVDIEGGEAVSIPDYVPPGVANNFTGGWGFRVMCQKCGDTFDKVKPQDTTTKLKNYRDNHALYPISRAKVGQNAYVCGMLVSSPKTKSIQLNGKEHIIQFFDIKDETGQITILYDDRGIPTAPFSEGKIYTFYGLVKNFTGSDKKYIYQDKPEPKHKLN